MAENGGQDALPEWILKPVVTPKQVATAFEILRKTDPGSALQMRGAVLADIVNKAVDAAPAGGFAISPSALAKDLRKHEDKLRHMYSGDAEGWSKVDDLMKVGDILRDQPALGGSQTAAKMWFRKAFEAIAMARWNPAALAAESSQIVTASRMARIINDPAKIEEFLHIVNTKPGPAAKVAGNITRASTRLLGMLEREEMLESEE
jgi:hypothetical protein